MCFARAGRKQTHRALREPFFFSSYRVVETRSKIFPCDGRGQFDEPRNSELRLQLTEARGIGTARCCSHLFSVIEDRLFESRKEITGGTVWQSSEFFFAHAVPARERRSDIDAEPAADDRRHIHKRELFQRSVDTRRSFQTELKRSHGSEYLRMMRHDSKRCRNPTETAPRHPIDKANKEISGGRSNGKMCHARMTKEDGRL